MKTNGLLEYIKSKTIYYYGYDFRAAKYVIIQQ